MSSYLGGKITTAWIESGSFRQYPNIIAGFASYRQQTLFLRSLRSVHCTFIPTPRRLQSHFITRAFPMLYVYQLT